ncbi:MAG: tetraacyldisaccharide 4'-kinase [Tannerella sp.]|nr:tetraacyldisaccharide 4'-kinase [Tannerella sp.]
MKNRDFKCYPVLRPFSFVYETSVRIRNLFFSWHLLPSGQYPVPVICIGNLAVGGTGKTPLVEYLIRLLIPKYKAAVLSRGYKRKSSGFIIANENSTATEIGDEPYQIKSKFPDIIVAVDKNRRRGMRKLLALPEEQRPQVILLDDAFQHRYVQPSLSIVVTDYNRLYHKDKLMPVGRLREPPSEIRRANMVVVSKTDASLEPIDLRRIENEMNLSSDQPLFFTTIVYQQMEGIYSNECSSRSLSSIKKEDEILLLTGIANPALLIREVKKYSDRVTVLNFADHHDFTKRDVKKIKAAFLKINTGHPFIISTEKDAARIRNNDFFPAEWKSNFYYVPIAVKFLSGKDSQFNEAILEHIETFANSRILRQ